MSKIDEILEKITGLQKALEEEGRKELGALFDGYFERHPDVECIRWNQFTPYFNDGEECIFGIHEIYLGFRSDTLTERQLKDYDSDDVLVSEDDELDYSEVELHEAEEDDAAYLALFCVDSHSYYVERWSPEQNEAFAEAKQISNVMRQLGSVMEVIYDNHCMVTVRAGGVVKVEEFEHE